MRAEAVDEYTITQFQRYWRDGERQSYRAQKEFRELWPEFETPNELARQVVKQMEEGKRPDSHRIDVPLSVPVLASEMP